MNMNIELNKGDFKIFPFYNSALTMLPISLLQI
jgi:hypothetical protein